MTNTEQERGGLRTIVFVDAVDFTKELHTYGRPAIVPKIAQLREFAEFFFVYKLKGTMIGEMGDGFLILCPPTPVEVMLESLACRSFIEAYNIGKTPPAVLNTRIALHFGLIQPPVGNNYIEANINLTARLVSAKQ